MEAATSAPTASAPLAAPAFARWANPNEIPIIDFAPLAGRSDAAVEAVAREVHDACRDIGFFTVVNHAVSPALIREAFAQSRRFFALPEAEKMKVFMGLSNSFRGYLPMDRQGEQTNFKGRAVEGFQKHLATEKLTARKPNKNEAFQISLDLAADDPDVVAGKPLHEPNQWPEGLPGFREGVMAYYDAMRAFANVMASMFARGLGLDPGYFLQFYRKPLIQLRLLHYLPQEPELALAGGDSRAHCDAGGFTMLQQDDVGGLEIMSRAGDWIVVPPVENSFVVNIGDSMKMWTNHRFASTLHRVVNRYGRERYSIGVFANPDYDTVITPLGTCVDDANPARFETMNSGEALLYLYSRVWPSRGQG